MYEQRGCSVATRSDANGREREEEMKAGLVVWLSVWVKMVYLQSASRV